MTAARQDPVDRFEAAISDAARDAQTPGVLACVEAPSIGLSWAGARPGPLAAGQEASADRPFRIASTTKMHVATALFRLVEQGRIGLTDTVDGLADQATIKALASGGYEPSAITVRHILTHTSGLRDHIAQAAYVETVMAEPGRLWSRAEQIDMMAAGGGPLAAPGAHYQYSDTGYVILGEIIERATNQPLGQAVRTLARFDRADQRSTWWEVDEPSPVSLDRARQIFGDLDFTDAAPHFDLYGGGGLISTVADLARFARALFRGDLFDTPGLTSAMLAVPPASRLPTDMIHGAGPMVLDVGHGYGWGHGGFWGCAVAYDGARDIAIAATVNQPRPVTPNLIYRLIADLGAAVTPRSP